jgi:hypothetical protein
MAMRNDGSVEPCSEHTCCIRARDVRTSSDTSHLAGEWHLQWMADDGAWFLVPPQGNVWEIRVTEGADPVGELAVDGVVSFDDIRAAIARQGLFPPC